MDMDGVLVHEEQALPGADRFLSRLRDTGTPFLVLTNNSIYTRRDLAARLRASGIDVPEESIWTSALATARFLESQRPGGSAFVIGEAGLTTALHEAGYTLTERDPDYVVLGETRTYSFERITHAIMGIVYGGMLAFLIPILWSWWLLPSALVGRSLAELAPLDWLLLVMALGVFLSGARDLYAALGLPGGSWPWPPTRAGSPAPRSGCGRWTAAGSGPCS